MKKNCKEKSHSIRWQKDLYRPLECKDNIACLYFIYVDYGQQRWDDKYWFCIGRTKDARFFSYESTCSGTGFGLGSKTKIYYAKDKDMLLTYGLEDKHRTFIEEHKNFLFVTILYD